WHGAVIYKQAGIDCREFETARLARSRIGRLGAAARAGDGMEIDVVHHDAVVMIFELYFDRISNPDADEWSRHLLVEGPVAIGRAIGEVARPSMVSRSTLTRRGPRLPIGGGRSTGSRTIDIGPSALTTLLTLCDNGTRPFAGCAWYVRGLLG